MPKAMIEMPAVKIKMPVSKVTMPTAEIAVPTAEVASRPKHSSTTEAPVTHDSRMPNASRVAHISLNGNARSNAGTAMERSGRSMTD